jgi:hypothetical protein
MLPYAPWVEEPAATGGGEAERVPVQALLAADAAVALIRDPRFGDRVPREHLLLAAATYRAAGAPGSAQRGQMSTLRPCDCAGWTDSCAIECTSH